MNRLIIHIPLASTHIPTRDGFLVDGARIEKELHTLTDWHTDDLFVDAAGDDHPGDRKGLFVMLLLCQFE